jgi:ribosome production factor 2
MMSRREPKNNRSRRALRKYEPKVLENPKTALFLKGNKCSEIVQGVMNDLSQLKKPHAVRFWKHNDFYPFETTKNLEFLGFKNDASLFCFGNHQKKRPHNLILGRFFDWQLLDMAEFHVADYDPMQSVKGIGFQLGSKPMMCFLGSHFQTNVEAQRVQNVLLDFFRGKEVQAVNLAGLDRLIVVTARPPKAAAVDPNSAVGFTFLFRQFVVLYKKATTGGALPSVELRNVGPSIDLVLRRTRLASIDNFKRACVIPRSIANVGKHQKNVSRDDMTNLRGQIHVGTTDLDQLALRKFKATKEVRKRKREEKVAAAKAAAKAATEGTEPAGDKPRKERKRRRKDDTVPEEERMSFEIQTPKQRIKKDAAERTVFVKANRKKKTKGIM